MEQDVPYALCLFYVHLRIIQSLVIVHHAVPSLNLPVNIFFTRPECCMDADGLFMGEATLRKIFCLQETLRGVWGRPLSESLLQPDRVLFLPSPLLQKKAAASQTPNKSVRCYLTPTLFSTHTRTPSAL